MEVIWANMAVGVDRIKKWSLLQNITIVSKQYITGSPHFTRFLFF